MCGILVVHGKRAVLERERCADALALMRRRGPDFSYSSLYEDGRLFFGQTVLSITGRPEGRVDAYHRARGGEVDVLLNGQIYNFAELDRVELRDAPPNLSGSDTETLARLHARQPARRVFDRVVGMYAYAVYDAACRRLVWARDPIGEKVLFVHEDEQQLVIASEIGPVLALCPHLRIDRDVLRDYFATRHLLTPDRTAFCGIDVVPAGSLHEYDLAAGTRALVSRRTIHSLVDAEASEHRSRASVDTLADELETVFRANARMLSTGRAGYGAIVSGGVDSTLAAAYLDDARAPSRNICLVFPGKDPVSEQVGRFAPHFRAPIERVVVDVERFAAAMGECYQAACAPLATHSFVSQAILSAQARADGLKVLVGGDGGDELFGGYEAYRHLAIGDGTRLPDVCPSPYSGLVASGIRFAGWDPAPLRERLAARWRQCLDAYAATEPAVDRGLQATLLCDTVVQLESVGLRCADQMNMLHSIEGRGFYLTEPVVRLALNLPASSKIDRGAEGEFGLKPLLKRAFERRFGRALLAPKQGFAGYPNEAAVRILDPVAGLKPVFDYLDITNDPASTWDRATEWKLLNVALFLRAFSRHA